MILSFLMAVTDVFKILMSQFFFTDVIPELPTEITIGIHDIFWPFDYPGHWINRYYNEQYVLGAYMLGVGLDFPLIFGCNFIGKNYSDVL